MSTLLRWGVVALATVHGLIHVMASAVRFGWIEDADLSPGGDGALWALAAVLLLATALLAAAATTVWWAVALTAVVVSQVVIVLSWTETSTGTLANVALLLAAGYALVHEGPGSFHAQWVRGTKATLASERNAPPIVTQDDLDGLPEPLAAYIRKSGAIGRPRPERIYLEFHGRIRADRHGRWTSFAGRQVSTFGSNPQRWFILDATRGGLPVTVLHHYGNATASMRGKLLSLLTVLDASGPEMDRGETVTVFNDLVVLAPGAIPGAPVRWTQIDDDRVRGVFTLGPHSVSAELVFDAHHQLVDFLSHDRPRASADGTSFTEQKWSTPSPRPRMRDGRPGLSGSARWCDDDGWFTYVEIDFDLIVDNPSTVEPASRAAAVRERQDA